MAATTSTTTPNTKDSTEVFLESLLNSAMLEDACVEAAAAGLEGAGVVKGLALEGVVPGI